MKKLLFTLCTIILIASACKSEPPSEKYRELEKSININMPRELNSQMRMDKAKAVSRYKFKYFYTLLNDPDMPATAFIESAKPRIANSLRGSAKSKIFKADNITFIYTYNRSDGNQFAEIVITPDEY